MTDSVQSGAVDSRIAHRYAANAKEESFNRSSNLDSVDSVVGLTLDRVGFIRARWGCGSLNSGNRGAADGSA